MSEAMPSPSASDDSAEAIVAPIRQEAEGAGRDKQTNPLAWAIISTALVAVWLGWNNTWQFALAGVTGIFVHELGHALTINAFGLGPSRIHFIPFFGGLATQPKPSPDQMKSVLIALAGPSFGLLAMLPFVVAFGLTGDVAWRDGAFFIAAINLLNLYPARPLDGSQVLGPVLARIHPGLELVAAVILGVIAIGLSLVSQMWIIALVIGFALFNQLRNRKAPVTASRLSGGQMAASVGLYLLAGLLCLGAIFGLMIQDYVLHPETYSG